MTVDGWIPVDPLTLETAYPGVYAVGDVTSVGTPKAGVFAEGQALVVADAIAARLRGLGVADDVRRAWPVLSGVRARRRRQVDVTFRSGEGPFGSLEGPSTELAADKVAFKSTRLHRWFGKPG